MDKEKLNRDTKPNAQNTFPPPRQSAVVADSDRHGRELTTRKQPPHQVTCAVEKFSEDVLIQSQENGMFFCDDGTWSTAPNEAYRFNSVGEAITVIEACGHRNVRLLLEAPDGVLVDVPLISKNLDTLLALRAERPI